MTARRFTIRDLGSLNGTFVNRRRIEIGRSHDDDEVQIGKYRMTFLLPMSTTTEPAGDRARLHTIGAVCERLRGRVPRHLDLEDPLPRGPGPAAPRRTRGGYRLFSEGDIERLETILRLQRDEFLPLRVIRDELRRPRHDQAKRRAPALRDAGGEIDLRELCERARDHGRLRAPARGVRPRDAADRGRASACTARARRRSPPPAADRAARARRAASPRLPDSRGAPVGTARAARRDRHCGRAISSGARAALDDLEALAASPHELAQLLLVRDLREASER